MLVDSSPTAMDGSLDGDARNSLLRRL